VQPEKKKHRRRAKKKGVKQSDLPQQPENNEGREEDNKVGSGDNRGDTEMRDVETHQNKNEGERGSRTQSRLKRATQQTDETTEKCERAEWRKRNCKSLL
jgi:hypothetical protein